MGRTVEQIMEEVDDRLCAIYDITDADDFTMQMIIEFCHSQKKLIAEYIKYR